MSMKSQVVCGVDIGGTNTVFGLVDLDGKILIEDSFSTLIGNQPHDFIKHLSSRIKKCLEQYSDELDLIGVGIGAPNGNYYTGEMVDPPNLPWGTVPIVELLSDHLQVPCKVTNDANAAALGEMQYGAAKKMKDFIVITLGTGLGSGIVVNGNIVYGYSGHAGELGHCIVEKNGRKCSCGLRGCLEAYASATGVVRTVKLNLEKKNLTEILGSPIENLSSENIYLAAKAGNQIALNAFKDTGKILGEFLATSVSHLHPEAIFLLGGLAKAGDLLFDPIIHAMNKNLLSVFKDQVKILPSALPDANAAILGAAALALEAIKKN